MFIIVNLKGIRYSSYKFCNISIDSKFLKVIKLKKQLISRFRYCKPDPSSIKIFLPKIQFIQERQDKHLILSLYVPAFRVMSWCLSHFQVTSEFCFVCNNLWIQKYLVYSNLLLSVIVLVDVYIVLSLHSGSPIIHFFKYYAGILTCFNSSSYKNSETFCWNYSVENNALS